MWIPRLGGIICLTLIAEMWADENVLAWLEDAVQHEIGDVTSSHIHIALSQMSAAL